MHDCTASFRRTHYVVTVRDGTGITAAGGTSAGLCPNNVCRVEAGRNVDLLATSNGNFTRILTGWSCATTTPQLLNAANPNLAFTATLVNVLADQTCTPESAPVAIVTTYQRTQPNTPPTVTVSGLHACLLEQGSPRESSNATICRVASNAEVVMEYTTPPGYVFREWECWTDLADASDVDASRPTANPLTVTNIRASANRVCQPLFGSVGPF